MLQHKGSGTKGARNIWGRTKLTSFRVSAEGTSLSRTEVLAAAIIPLLNFLPTQLADARGY